MTIFYLVLLAIAIWIGFNDHNNNGGGRMMRVS